MGFILEPGPSPTFFSKPDLGSKTNFTDGAKICAIVGYEKA